jgi:hypothetical protein
MRCSIHARSRNSDKEGFTPPSCLVASIALDKFLEPFATLQVFAVAAAQKIVDADHEFLKLTFPCTYPVA